MLGLATGTPCQMKDPVLPTPRKLGGLPWTGPSEVDHVASQAVDRLLQPLAERRVRVHVARQLGRGEIPPLRQRQLGQQLGDLGADEVPAEQLAVRLVSDQL